MAVLRKYAKVQKKGQVTIPAEFREKLGLKEGDLVAFLETDAGILISPQETQAVYVLEQIGQALKERGVTLDELMDLGRTERATIIKETYHLTDPA